MKWPWSRPDLGPRANVEKAMAELIIIRARRNRVEQTARRIREGASRNNFAANTFRLNSEKPR